LTPELFQKIAIGVLIAVACYTDLTIQKIKNWLTFPTMAIGTVLSFWTLGSFWLGAAGVLAGMAACFFPWKLGAIKAGDVKMLMAAGALLGPVPALRATVWMLFLGIPVGLLVLAVKGKLGNVKRVVVDGQKAEATVVAHAPVVGMGIIAAMTWPGLF
jgi:prepilin peptidase CpaA